MSTVRTIEQRRAEHAWRAVKAVAGEGGSVASDYLGLARGAAADIQVNGLGQTLAFWRAKAKGDGDGAHQRLLDHVGSWVGPQMGAPDTGLLEWLVAPTTGSAAYRRATWEALAYLKWVKRFAEAELDEKKGKGRESRGGGDGGEG